MSMLEDFQRLMQVEDDETGFPCVRRSFASTSSSDHYSLSAFARASNAVLSHRLIGLIHSQTPDFFENLVLDVLEKMLKGKRQRGLTRRLGQTGDGGVDGIIALDDLGLDQVYFQAKRLRPGTLVPVADVRDFAGALEARHSSKGVFVTTTEFPLGAIEFCARISRRLVLIDGGQLADLMILNNIGVKLAEAIEIKQIDLTYFNR
jgi:restriction system protein